MSFEPILAFLLIRYLYRRLRKFSPDAKWNKILNSALYAIVALAFLQFFMHNDSFNFISWLWDALLLAIVYEIEKDPLFAFAKK